VPRPQPGEDVFIRTLLNAYREAYSGLPRDVWLVSAALLINRAGTMVLPFLSLYFTVDRGLSITDAGALMALYGVGAVVGSYLGGWLADRIGALRTQHLSLLAGGAGFLWLVTLDDLRLIAPAVFVVSLVFEAFRPAAMAALAARAPAGLQLRSFALLRLAANLGMSIGPAIGGWLALYSYDWLFVGDAATCWAASAFLFFTLGVADRSHAGSHAERSAAGSPLADGPFLLLLLLVTGVAMVLFQIFTTVPIYLRQVHGFPESTIGSLLALNALLIVIFEMVLIHKVDHWRRMVVIALGAFLFCLGLGLMPFGASLPYLAFTVLVWTLGEMLSLPMFNAVIASRAQKGNHGRYMGLYSVAFSLAFIAAPAIGTRVYDRFGPDALWLGIGAFGVPLALLALALTPAFRREPPFRSSKNPQLDPESAPS
jgi:predicted MFS family arabinose efflux permease